MDLLTYAVRQKMACGDGLLQYVVKDAPVPVSVIENSFRGYLEPLSDEASERLIEDYAQMLNENVPLVIRADGETGGYEISGEIPDNVLEAVMLVHKIEKPEYVINALASYNLATVHGQAHNIINTDLNDRAMRTLLQAAAIPAVIPAMDKVPAEEAGSANDGLLDAMPKDMPMGDVNVPVWADGGPTEGILKTADEGTGLRMEDTTDEDALMMEGTLEDTTDEDATMMEGILETAGTEDAIEEGAALDMTPVEDMEPLDGAPNTFAQAVQNIYRKFCEDLHSFGLDERLNLQLA